MSSARIQSVDGPDDAPSVIVPEQHGTEFARKRGVGQRVDGLRKAFTTKYDLHYHPPSHCRSTQLWCHGGDSDSGSQARLNGVRVETAR